MKKLLGKKWFMITSIAVAVAVLVFYIGMLVRPISLGMTYKYSETVEGETLAMDISFKNGKKVDMKVSMEGATMEAEFWYLKHDGIVFIVGPTNTLTEADYKAEADYIKNNLKDALEEAREYATYIVIDSINAFEAEIEGDTLKCSGAVVFTIVMGLVEAGLITLVVFSSILSLKKKPEEVQENAENKEVA
ncbi:MAG: hypothetical protein J6Q13_00450 [Clostridia bacterium]|nr:hypothetical protein [Clostridia bacterium]